MTPDKLNVMKKYILIQNDGEIETNSFELIGASTKRGQEGKIGFFGSGLKYSIAYMMRNNIEFRVFSGETELIFSTTPETLRDQTFERICINGKPTSYTTTMGPTWKEDWFVFREIYCNAIDETGCQVVKETANVNPALGKTRVFIELTPKLRQVSENWDRYFSVDREPIFTMQNIYTCYLAADSKNGGYINGQSVHVYHKTDGVLYRKGIRVYSNDEYAYDYGVAEADINEDRTASQAGAVQYAMCDIIERFPCENYIKSILRTAVDETPCYEYTSMNNRNTNEFSDRWVAFSRENLLVVKEVSGKYVNEVQEYSGEVFYIPASFARRLKRKFPECTILGMGKSIGKTDMSDTELTPKMAYLLKDAIQSLKEMKYEVPYEITIAKFLNERVLGQADIKEKKIYISDSLFDMGRREIAMTIIEECEHIRSGKEDETRGFQNHLISSWLTSMENSNGLFL